jgi:hypothetical protein
MRSRIAAGNARTVAASTRRVMDDSMPLAALANLGPKSQQALAAAGITSKCLHGERRRNTHVKRR